MGRIFQDNRSDDQRREAQDRAEERRAEWDEHYAANPARVVIVDRRGNSND
jgi:hypothetical protein